MDFLMYTFVLEVVACCCGTRLLFMVLTFSSFLLSVSHRFSWWLWLCPLWSSVCVHFLVLSTADTDYWRRPRRGFPFLYQATSCKTCDLWSWSLAWPKLSITRPRTCRWMSPINELLYHYFGFRRSAQFDSASGPASYLKETHFLSLRNVSGCAEVLLQLRFTVH